MADFCRQCWDNVYNTKDYQGDLAKQSTEANTNNGIFAFAICEGCGPTLVDHTGLCVSIDCYSENHSAVFDNKD